MRTVVRRRWDDRTSTNAIEDNPRAVADQTSQGREEPSPWIRRALKLASGEMVVASRSRLTLSGRPLELREDYVSASFAGGGAKAGGEVDQVRARVATGDEQDRLQLEPGAVVLITTTVCCDPAGRPVIASVTTRSAGEHVLEYRL
jgi:DNA-binding GntR family transcriptional regulator